MTKKVFIYSIETENAQGLHDWVNDTSGKKLKKTKFGRCTTSVMASYSPKRGGLANYISYTPATDPITGEPKKNEDGSIRMLQDELEEKYQKPKGFLTNKSWRKGESLEPADMTYYQTKSWQLNDGATVLDLDIMDEELGYYVMLESPLVANSEKEWRAHKWPKAQFYIALENEGEEIKYRKNALKSAAFASLHSKELTPVDKRKLVGLLNISNTRLNLTEEQVHNLLYAFIESSTFTPDSNINKFNTLTTLLTTPKGKDEFEARYLLQRLIDNRIVYEKQGTYTWIRPKGKLDIGARYEDAVGFMLDPKKDIEVKEMKEQLIAKE